MWLYSVLNFKELLNDIMVLFFFFEIINCCFWFKYLKFNFRLIFMVYDVDMLNYINS